MYVIVIRSTVTFLISKQRMIIGIGVFVVVIFILGYFMRENRSLQKGNDSALKFIYTILIGIFLAVFVGVGIAAFYPGPKFPDAPVAVKYGSPDMLKNSEMTGEQRAEIEKFDREEKDYQVKSRIYNRIVSTAALLFAIIIVVASLTFFRTMLLIADGLLLGGVLTLLYSVIRGFEADDNMFRFIVVSVGLFISLVLGYVKFIKPAKKTTPTP